MELTIAHLSDLHLGPLPPVRVGELLGKRLLGYASWQRGRRRRHTATALDAIIDDIKGQRIDHTVITGDLVNIGLPDEFPAAERWLRRFGTPAAITVIPGNHDAYVASAMGGWRHWAAYMGGGSAGGEVTFPFLRHCGPAVIIGLSTAIPTPAGFASGIIGEPQLRAFERLLQDLAGDPAIRIVLLHHPPVPGWSKRRKALRDADRVREVIARHGADLILCGHEHRLAVGALDGRMGEVPVFCAPSASLGSDQRRHGGGYLVYRFAISGSVWQMQAEHRAPEPQSGRIEVRLRASFSRSDEGRRRLNRVA